MAAIMPDSDSEDELPPGWEERATVDGSVYYVNHATKGTQWTHPRTGKKKVVSGDLPFGWEKCVSEDGKVFYVDHANRRTTYNVSSYELSDDGKGADSLSTPPSSSKRSCRVGSTRVSSSESENVKKTEIAIDKIKSERANASCDLIELDLSRLHSVKNFIANFKLRYKKLDMLILNAAVFGIPFSLTPDGYETTFEVNHLSHMFSNINGSTISQTILSPLSATHYWSMMAYNNSKLCNLLFGLELARRWEDKGIIVNILHPGNMVSSHLSRNWWLYRLLFAIVRPFTKSLQQAASTSVYCATAPELEGATGLYFNNCCRCEPSVPAQDPDLARILWELSERMIQSIISPEKNDSSHGDH
ncbi:WW domain-containing oxidoreductase [Blattella germanica]|nr:WW domain-containing oxidoreductase [Blattella germanica]